MTDLREAGDISTGELLDGRYRLEHRIGEGGMARVYRAVDTHLNRTVAIKILRGPIGGSEVLERARAETRVLASLNHHSIVTVFDARISESDGSFIVMECVEGITLRDRIRQGPIDERDVATIAVDIAEALHVAHSAGIVHRDIKPSNVLLGPSPLPGPTWRAKLADFGIAFLLDTTRVTTPGLVVGTPAYIAPEQAQGTAPAPASDIYGFGLMLIEAMTGTRPYADAEGIGALVARLITSPDIPDSLSPEWQGLLRGMTATRADDRPTALEVATSAARLAAASAVAPVDLPTEAAPLPTSPTSVLPPVAAAGAAGGALAGSLAADDGGTPSPPTHPTAIVPVVEEPPSLEEPALPPAGPPVESESREGDAAHSRRRLIAGVAAAAAVIVAIAALVWSMNLSAGSPGPVPSAPVVEPTPQQPSQAPTQQAPPPPVDEVDDGGISGEDDGGNGAGNEGNGNGNPGNSNGNPENSNGNPGNGNGNSGNGNGNGNSGNGNETETETGGSETETDPETEPGSGTGTGETPAPSTNPEPSETSLPG